MSILEIGGTILGVFGVWLMLNQSIWGWPVGLVQVSIYTWVFFDARLLSGVLLQIIYLLIHAYGWWHWLLGSKNSEPLRVSSLSSLAILGWILLGAVGTAGWGWFMDKTTDAALPWWDAFILVFSLISQWLQARKNVECWLGWMIVNTVAMGVYWANDLKTTSVLYGIFLLMAFGGWCQWRRSFELNPV